MSALNISYLWILDIQLSLRAKQARFSHPRGGAPIAPFSEGPTVLSPLGHGTSWSRELRSIMLFYSPHLPFPRPGCLPEGPSFSFLSVGLRWM